MIRGTLNTLYFIIPRSVDWVAPSAACIPQKYWPDPYSISLVSPFLNGDTRKKKGIKILKVMIEVPAIYSLYSYHIRNVIHLYSFILCTDYCLLHKVQLNYVSTCFGMMF